MKDHTNSHHHPSLISIFENTVDRYPNNLALICDDLCLSYQALDKITNQYAHCLLSKKIGPGSVVGIFLPRLPECYLLMLALYKIGATVVPISEEAPVERVGHILGDLEFTAIISTKEQIHQIKIQSAKTLRIDKIAQEASTQSTARIDLAKINFNPNSSCYIIYTSGSTGKPNGVAVGHQSICHYIKAASSVYEINAQDKIYHGFSIAFDAALEEIWMAFANGACLVIASSKEIRSGLGLIEFLNQHQISVFSTVPTLLASLQGEVDSLRLLILGGENLNPKILEPWHRPGLKILNTYGPTEATVVSTYAECKQNQPLTIGKALPGYEILILNETLEPLPPGEIGELCIAGLGLAQGYVNRPEITAKKFIQHPLNPEARMYRTGDLALWDDQGNIVFKGRTDHQVKLRGFRLELNEIEARIMAYPGIQNCAVTVLESANPKLVAYITQDPAHPIDIDKLKTFLSEHLPPFMLPSVFEDLEHLPLLDSGKINRKQLPPPKSLGDNHLSHPPKTKLEKKIADIFCKHLQITELSVHDKFFKDLGGHSLSAASVISELRLLPEFHRLSMRDLYDFESIQALIKAFKNPQKETKTEQKTEPTQPWRHRLCTLAQGLGIMLQYLLKSSQILAFFMVFHHLSQDHDMLSLPMAGAFLGLCTLVPILSILTVVLFKWVLLGRVKPGQYPLWGWFYCRWWFVSRLESILFPLSYFAGTPLIILYYRLMGAKIGKHTHIDSPNLGMHDMIRIGDHSSINHNAQLQAQSIDNGFLQIGPISIGSDCYVGIRAVLGRDCVMEDGAALDDLSLLPNHSQIPRKAFFKGSPGQLSSCPSNHIVAKVAKRPSAKALSLKPHAFFEYLAVFLVEAVYIVCYLPPMIILIGLAKHQSLGLSALLSPIAGLAHYLLFSCSVLLIKKLCPRIKAGLYPGDGLSCFAQNLIKRFLIKQEISVMADSLYCPAFLKLLGAKVGKNVEVGELSDLVPDLISIDDGGTIASSVTIAQPRRFHDIAEFGNCHIGKNSFVGNHGILSAGDELSDFSILGCLSTLPKDQPTSAKHVTWLGSPAILLANREQVEQKFNHRYAHPTLKMKIHRLAIELVRIIMPSTLTILDNTLLYTLFDRMINQMSKPMLLLMITLSQMGIVLGFFSLFIALKWMLMGRYKTAMYHLWDPFIRKRDVIEFIYGHYMIGSFIDPLLGTAYLAFFLRCLGAKIGRYACIQTSGFEEFDLIHLKDEVSLNKDCVLQTHLYEDKIYKIGPINIASFCHVGENSLILYNTEMHQGAKLGALSLLMKGETLLTNTHWEGCPAAASED